MQASDLPAKNTVPFANGADSTHKRVIPTPSQAATSTDAPASFTDGFPPLTFLNKAAGGIPPNGADENGILNFITAWTRWIAAGGSIVPYDGAFSSSAGGYPKGAIVASATFGKFWLSTVDANLTNPDSGGAGWRQFSTGGGLINVQTFGGSGTYTPTPGTNMIEVTVVGGGGGGGGSSAMSASQFAAAGGGGAGGTAIARFTSGFSSVAVGIGPGGAGGAGTNNGGVGGTTSFLSLSATGGGGGSYANAASIGSTQLGGAGGIGSGGTILNSSGGPGASSVAFQNSNLVSGAGGNSTLAGGGTAIAGTGTGQQATGPGAGGGGAVGQNSAGAQAGGNGTNGIVIIREYA